MARRPRQPDPDAKPMPALTGNMWVPVWAIRPGSYGALSHVAGDMSLWLLLHSYTAAHKHRACYVSREVLGATLGTSRATTARSLTRLADAHLLWTVERAIDNRSRRHRPPARYALDPFAAKVWREEVEADLARIAEEDGYDGRWLHNAVTSLDAFDRRSRGLRNALAEDMPVVPKDRRSRKKPKKKRAMTQNEPTTQKDPGGEVLYQGKGEKAVAPLHPDPSKEEKAVARRWPGPTHPRSRWMTWTGRLS